MTRASILLAVLMVSPLARADAPPPPGQPAPAPAPQAPAEWTAAFGKYATAYTAGDAAGADAAIAELKTLMGKEIAANAPAPAPAPAAAPAPAPAPDPETRNMIGRRDVRVERRDDRQDARHDAPAPAPAAAPAAEPVADSPLVAEQKQILARFDGYTSDFASDAGRTAAQERYADLQRFEALILE